MVALQQWPRQVGLHHSTRSHTPGPGAPGHPDAGPRHCPAQRAPLEPEAALGKQPLVQGYGRLRTSRWLADGCFQKRSAVNSRKPAQTPAPGWGGCAVNHEVRPPASGAALRSCLSGGSLGYNRLSWLLRPQPAGSQQGPRRRSSAGWRHGAGGSLPARGSAWQFGSSLYQVPETLPRCQTNCLSLRGQIGGRKRLRPEGGGNGLLLTAISWLL